MYIEYISQQINMHACVLRCTSLVSMFYARMFLSEGQERTCLQNAPWKVSIWLFKKKTKFVVVIDF